jgi:branched-chain amino acid transport system permease protein
LFGVPSLRVKGFYLAISTIAAQFIIIWVLSHWSSLTGGFMGIKVPYASVGGFQFASESSQFYLIFAVAALSTFFALNLARTRVGRAFVAIRDNDLAAQVMGINIFHYKLLAFFLGCFFAGISGCLLAHWTGTISTENFTLSESVKYVGIIIIGGLGSSIGPILGVLLIWPGLLDYGVTNLTPALQSAFPSLPSGFTTGIGPMLFGLVIILFLVFEPRGMAHRWSLFKSAYRLWPFSY